MKREMRRQDRKVTDPALIEACMKESICLHVGFNDEGEVYILPVNFGYVIEDGRYTLYFHGASAGRKYDLAKNSPAVGIEMESRLVGVTADKACNFSQDFLSIIGNGICSIVEDENEKVKGLTALMTKISGRSDWEFPEAMLKNTTVFKVEVTELSCKEHVS